MRAFTFPWSLLVDRVAVFVDAGHLFAGGSTALTGAPKKRTEITLDVAQAAAFLERKAVALSGLPLLRIYWYDGALPAGLTTDQHLLASTNNIKLRLGIVNGHGEQKGVDAKIVTDLAELARNGALCDAVLIGGDEDLRIGVELAQERGVRVHLLTVVGTNVSTFLKREADTASEISVAELSTFMAVTTPTPTSSTAPTVSPAAPAPAPASGSALPDFADVVADYLSTLAAPDQQSLASAIKTGGGIPSDHDGRILGRARDSLGRSLNGPEKTALRKEVRRQLGI